MRRILDEGALREHCFDWLLGDPNGRGARARLPVDAYYPRHRLVLEYWEAQHDEATPFFDKPDRLTVSGMHWIGRASTAPRALNRELKLVPSAHTSAKLSPSFIGHSLSQPHSRLKRGRPLGRCKPLRVGNVSLIPSRTTVRRHREPEGDHMNSWTITNLDLSPHGPEILAW